MRLTWIIAPLAAAAMAFGAAARADDRPYFDPIIVGAAAGVVVGAIVIGNHRHHRHVHYRGCGHGYVYRGHGHRHRHHGHFGHGYGRPSVVIIGRQHHGHGRDKGRWVNGRDHRDSRDVRPRGRDRHVADQGRGRR